MFEQAGCLLFSVKSPASKLAGAEGGAATSIILVGREESSLLPGPAQRLRSPHVAPEKQILA